MKLVGCLLTVAASLLAVTYADDPPVAHIKAGRLVGKTVHSKSLPKPVHTFLGVPYAQPPVGDLRLALPQPVTPWEGDRDATKYGAACPHDETMVRELYKPFPIVETAFSEDCLSVNVYTPDMKGKRDVLFLIHGGGFTGGKNSYFDGSAYVALGDIVVVSINYRIGLLGFIQTDEGYWPKNLGFRDQQFALRWARDNIAAFGGDPEKITVGGESAGSISTSLHVVSPGSRGLFHRAICQSGSLFTMGWTTKEPFSAMALQKLNCSGLDGDGTLACLRSKSVEDFLQTELPATVVPDGDVYPLDPVDAYPKEDFPNVDMLIGVTEEEGALFATMIVPAVAEEELDVDAYGQQLKGFLQTQYGNNVDEIYEKIVEYYFGEDMTGYSADIIRQKTGDIIGTSILGAPTYYNAQVHADRGANTFFYRFVYQPSFMRDMRPSWHSGGCDHGLDITFTTGFPLMLDLLPEEMNVTDEDIEMTKIAMQYWINFVKTGNPNGEGLVEWQPFTREQEDYLILQPDCKQASAFKPDDMSFWNEKIRAIDVPAKEQRDEL